MSHRLLSAAIAATAITLSSTSALAWGDEGHKVVATIAYGLLSNSAKSQVDALLADDPVPAKCGSGSFVADAVWADKLRAKSRQCSSGIKWGRTSSWHFLDIPLAAKAYDHQRDCPKDDCVVAKIAYFRDLLADKAKPKARRRDALKFLIHFVGDLHQPLHTTSAPFDEHRAEDAEQEGARRNTCLIKHLAMDRGGQLCRCSRRPEEDRASRVLGHRRCEGDLEEVRCRGCHRDEGRHCSADQVHAGRNGRGLDQ